MAVQRVVKVWRKRGDEYDFAWSSRAIEDEYGEVHVLLENEQFENAIENMESVREMELEDDEDGFLPAEPTIPSFDAPHKRKHNDDDVTLYVARR